MANDSDKTLADARGLDYHGADPVSHRFTIADADGREQVPDDPREGSRDASALAQRIRLDVREFAQARGAPVKLTFLGTRGYVDPVSSRHRMHTATLVEYRGTRVMIDCGEMWLGRLDGLRPHAVVITHAHPDHAFGLEHGSPCPVYATRSAWAGMRGFPIPPERRCTLRLRDSVAIGGIVFETFAVVHSIRAPAVGYRVSAGRVKVFYVPDVVSIRARSDALRDISVYIGDGATITRNMVRRERKTGTPIGHTPISRQLDWCRDEGVPRMIVTHCGSDIVGGDEAAATARLKMLAARRGVAITVAHDGMELVLR